MGVFATRSPFRPNSLGLSCVKLNGIREDREFGPVITVAGADILDGTPIYDIKPYLPYADCHNDAVGGFTAGYGDYQLNVKIPDGELEKIPESKRHALMGILAEDPRPSYQDDSQRVYGMNFAGFEIKFSVSERELTVLAIENTTQQPQRRNS